MAIVTNPIIDVDRETGDLVKGWARIRQSIITILTTRIKTRIMRLWWGSEFLDAQDKPGNEEVFLKSIIAAVEAIDRYEPEFKITSVLIPEWGPTGNLVIEVVGTDLTADQSKRLTVTI